MAEQPTTNHEETPAPRSYRLTLRVLVVLLAVGLLAALLAGAIVRARDARPALPITGRVVDLDGKPLAGAQVISPEGQTVVSADGSFTLPAHRFGEWITVKHPGYLARTRAAAPGESVIVRLTPDDGKTVLLHFAGDAMFGRRFYDRNEDGDTSDGILQPGAGPREHLALLQHVQPLLETADLTIVNLETPLTPEPYSNPTSRRPDGFHPQKDYVFATAAAAAVALREAGVDVVGLGNNHLYDALDQGVQSTRASLQQAGFEAGVGYTGAGMSEQAAWMPAIQNVRGQSVAFLACTAITGIEHSINYVASDVAKKGGAAKCDGQQIGTAIADAKARNDVVVMMIHGGQEYVRAPTEITRPLIPIRSLR